MSHIFLYVHFGAIKIMEPVVREGWTRKTPALVNLFDDAIRSLDLVDRHLSFFFFFTYWGVHTRNVWLFPFYSLTFVHMVNGDFGLTVFATRMTESCVLLSSVKRRLRNDTYPGKCTANLYFFWQPPFLFSFLFAETGVRQDQFWKVEIQKTLELNVH